MSPNSSLTEQIIQSVIKVHQALGPGFLERIYHNAMVVELANRGFVVESEKEISIYYEGELVGVHRLDLLVDNRVVVEFKTVEDLAGIHYAQVRSYLKAANQQLGLLVNFAKDRADYRRVELSPK